MKYFLVLFHIIDWGLYEHTLSYKFNIDVMGDAFVLERKNDRIYNTRTQGEYVMKKSSLDVES